MNNQGKNFAVIIIGLVLLVGTFFISVSFGAAKMTVGEVWRAILAPDNTLPSHQMIWDIRLPRVLATGIVGACFALSGAIMQGITRNPMADSGLLGINSGATFALAICFAFIPGYTYTQAILFSFAGAALGVAMTYYVSALTKGKMTPERLVLAGVTVSLLFTALSQFMGIYFGIGQELTYWNVGGVAGVSWNEVITLLPWGIAAVFCSLMLAPSISVLALGEEVAIGLGKRVMLIKTTATIIVLISAGLAVSVVGPVGFVGLIIPHTMRYFVGHDYRYIIPSSIIYGAIFMILADLGGRMLFAPYETPMGIIFALIGVPFFLYIASREKVGF